MLGFPKPRDYQTDLEKKGLAQFGPVAVWAGIALILILLAAILLLSREGKKMSPGNFNPHPNSQILLPPSETAA
jgi:hypothetical protein